MTDYTPEFVERFWAKVDRLLFDDMCWNWIAGLDTGGYGQIQLHGKTARAHRISYELAYSPIPGDLHVLHKCDNRRCVNPHHLFLGTHQDNMIDMYKKGRVQRHGERNGNCKLTDIQVAEIRRLYAAGDVNYVELGKVYRVATSTISRIVHYKKRQNPT